MSTANRKLNMAKKTTPQDWHRADIKASLDKAGTSMARLSREHDYSSGSLRLALRLPWPKAEAIIAAALGVSPQTIWPSRYHPDGTPKSGRGQRGLGRYKPSAVVYSVAGNSKYNNSANGCNVNDQATDRKPEHRKEARRSGQDRRAA